jgi:hypothetical protein
LQTHSKAVHGGRLFLLSSIFSQEIKQSIQRRDAEYTEFAEGCLIKNGCMPATIY